MLIHRSLWFLKLLSNSGRGFAKYLAIELLSAKTTILNPNEQNLLVTSLVQCLSLRVNKENREVHFSICERNFRGTH